MKGKLPSAKQLKDWLFKGYTNFMGGKIIKSLFSGGIAEAFLDIAEEELGGTSAMSQVLFEAKEINTTIAITLLWIFI